MAPSKQKAAKAETTQGEPVVTRGTEVLYTDEFLAERKGTVAEVYRDQGVVYLRLELEATHGVHPDVVSAARYEPTGKVPSTWRLP